MPITKRGDRICKKVFLYIDLHFVSPPSARVFKAQTLAPSRAPPGSSAVSCGGSPVRASGPGTNGRPAARCERPHAPCCLYPGAVLGRARRVIDGRAWHCRRETRKCCIVCGLILLVCGDFRRERLHLRAHGGGGFSLGLALSAAGLSLGPLVRTRSGAFLLSLPCGRALLVL